MNSWIGGGLSSLKGQLSHLITEGTEEHSDSFIEIEKTKKKISDLENELENLTTETNELKERNNELSMKLQSEELLLQNVSQSYQDKLKEKEEIIESLTNKMSRFRGVSEGSQDDGIPCSSLRNCEDNLLGEYSGNSYQSANEIHALKHQINTLNKEISKWKSLSKHQSFPNVEQANEFDNTLRILLEEQQRELELQHSNYVMELQYEHTNQIQFLNHKIQRLQQAADEDEDNQEFSPDSMTTEPVTTVDVKANLEKVTRHEMAIQTSGNDGNLLSLLDAFGQVATQDQIKSILINMVNARINNSESLIMESLYGIERISEYQDSNFNSHSDITSTEFRPSNRNRTISTGGMSDSQLAVATRLPNQSKHTRPESISQVSDISELSIKSKLLDEHVKNLSSQLTDYENQLICIDELSTATDNSGTSTDRKIDSKISNLKSKLCERKLNVCKKQINISEVVADENKDDDDEERNSNVEDSWENASINSQLEEQALITNQKHLNIDIFDSYRSLFPNVPFDDNWDVVELLRNVLSSVAELLATNKLFLELERELLAVYSETQMNGNGIEGGSNCELLDQSQHDIITIINSIKHSVRSMKETCVVHNYIQEENKSLQQLVSQCQLRIASLDSEKSDLLTKNSELDEQLIDLSITVARYEGLEKVCDSYQRQLAEAASVVSRTTTSPIEPTMGIATLGPIKSELSMDSDHILEHVESFNQEKDECIQTLEAKIISLQNLCEEKDDDINELKRREQNIVYEYDSLIEVLKSELEALRVDLDKHKEDQLAYKQQQQQLQESVHEKESMIQSLNAELTMLSVIDIESDMVAEAAHSGTQSEPQPQPCECTDKCLQTEADENFQQSLIDLEEQIGRLLLEKERLEQVLTAQANSLSQYEVKVTNLQHQQQKSLSATASSMASAASVSAATAAMDDMAKETLHHLAQMIRDKEWEIEALKSKNESLCEIIKQFTSGSDDQSSTRESALECIELILNEKESLAKELVWYQENREQLISALNVKHKESVNYHGEIQRLIAYINNEQTKWNEAAAECEQMRQQQQQNSQSDATVECSEQQLVDNIPVSNDNSTTMDHTPRECYQCKDIKNQLENLQKENRMTAAEMRAIQKHAEQISFELEQAQLQIIELTSSYNRAQQQLQFCQNELTNQYRTNVPPSNSDDSTKSIWNTEYHKENITTNDGAIDEKAQYQLLVHQKQIECDNYASQIEQLRARENKLLKEKQIFQDHLIRIEDSYTQEATLAEDREQTLRKQLHDIEDNFQQATDNISNLQSIIANIRNELSDEMNELRIERDELKLQLNETQIQLTDNIKSLGNLQSVLEKFQQEQTIEMLYQKERFQQDINRLIEERDSCDEKSRRLQNEMDMQRDLVDAAQRLTDQVELKDDQLAELQALLSKKEEVIDNLKMEIRKLNSFTESKVDKVLMKNLVIGYFHTPTHRRQEALKVIGSLLQFADSDYNQIGIDTANKSRWFSWLRPTAGDKGLGTDDRTKSFSELFITFLENESSPFPQVKLPTNQIAAEARQHSSLSQSDEYPYTHSTSVPSIIDHHKFFPTSSPIITKRNGSPSNDHDQTIQQQIPKPSSLLYIPNIPDINPDNSQKEFKASSNHRRSDSNRNVLLSLLDQ